MGRDDWAVREGPSEHLVPDLWPKGEETTATGLGGAVLAEEMARDERP